MTLEETYGENGEKSKKIKSEKRRRHSDWAEIEFGPCFCFSEETRVQLLKDGSSTTFKVTVGYRSRVGSPWAIKNYDKMIRMSVEEGRERWQKV